MHEEMIFSDLKRIMATLLKLESQEIDSMASVDSVLRDELGIDSVESLDFLTAIESLYKIQISDEEAATLVKVSDVIRLILTKKIDDK